MLNFLGVFKICWNLHRDRKSNSFWFTVILPLSLWFVDRLTQHIYIIPKLSPIFWNNLHLYHDFFLCHNCSVPDISNEWKNLCGNTLSIQTWKEPNKNYQTKILSCHKGWRSFWAHSWRKSLYAQHFVHWGNFGIGTPTLLKLCHHSWVWNQHWSISKIYSTVWPCNFPN